jgi:hypothetical protein
VMLFPSEVICAFVFNRFGREPSNVFIVDAIHIVASSEKINGAFCFGSVIKKNVRMRFEYHAICLLLIL